MELHPVELPGSGFIMEETFYRKLLEDKFVLEVIIPEAKDSIPEAEDSIPEAEDRDFVNHVIFNELCTRIKMNFQVIGAGKLSEKLFQTGVSIL